MIELAVRDLVAANGTVIQYGAKIYPLRLPQTATYPNIVYTRIAGNHLTHLTAPSGLCQATIQLDFRARDYDIAKYLADAVRITFNGYRNITGDLNSGFKIQGAHLIGDSELDESPYAADDLPIFRVQHDYHVWYEEYPP